MSRRPDDFYPTPEIAVTELFLELEDSMMGGEIVDPACGTGHLLCAGWALFPSRQMVGVEIDPDRRAAAQDELPTADIWWEDYLHSPPPVHNPALIVANPPYSLAQEFVTKMLNERGKDTIVAVLLRLGFLASQKRANWWRSIGPPSAIRVLSKRPSFTGDGKTDNSEYCWMIWNPPGRALGLAPLGWYDCS